MKFYNTEPYRQITRSGHDLEQLMVYSINSARESVDVAVQELRLPRIAQALAHRHRSGIKVRLIIENLYNRPIALSPSQVAALPKRERDRYAELFHLADSNKDGSLSDAEISSGDALAIVREAGIPMSKLPSTDLITGTVWAFNSPEMILHIAKQSRTFGLIYESPNSSNILTAV